MINQNEILSSDIRLCDIDDDYLMNIKYQWFKQIRYEPFKEQNMFHKSKCRFKILAAGTRFGKSMSAAKEVEPYLLIPGDILGWIVAPTYQLGEKEFRYIWDDMIVKMQLPAKRKNYNVRAGDMCIEFEWGAKLYVRSLKNIFDNLGEEVDFMIISEAAQVHREDWERVLRGRLASKKGKCVIPTTPKGKNWVFDMFNLGQDENYIKKGWYQSWLFPNKCNPYLDPLEIDDMERTMDRRFFREQCGGEFVSMTGSVYPGFDDANITNYLPFDHKPESRYWEMYRAIDFGYTNPFVCLLIAIEPIEKIFLKGFDKNGKEVYDSISYERHWIVDEYYEKARLIGEHAELIKEMSEPYKDRIVGTICDSEDPQAIDELSEFLPDVIPVEKEPIKTGIQKVSSKIETKVDNNSLLMVLDYCSNTIREFREYEWKPQPKVERNEDEEPKKKNDHAMDAYRYFVTMRSQQEVDIREVDLYGPNE